jgi:hypothetical protein
LVVESGLKEWLHPLSPQESKFRVKGNTTGLGLAPLFLDLISARINEVSYPPFETFQREQLFSLGRRHTISDNALEKIALFGGNGVPKSANLRDGAGR